MASAWYVAEPPPLTLSLDPIYALHEISNKKNFTKKERALASSDIPVTSSARHITPISGVVDRTRVQISI